MSFILHFSNVYNCRVFRSLILSLPHSILRNHILNYYLQLGKRRKIITFNDVLFEFRFTIYAYICTSCYFSVAFWSLSSRNRLWNETIFPAVFFKSDHELHAFWPSQYSSGSLGSFLSHPGIVLRMRPPRRHSVGCRRFLNCFYWWRQSCVIK